MSQPVQDLTGADAPAAGQTIARAFRGDPLFSYVFDGAEHYDRVAPWMFATWARWAVLYGRAWATPGMEAVALRRVPGRFDMSMWSLLRAGMLPTPQRLGKGAMGRFQSVIRLLEEQHARIIGKAPHWYCWMIAVLPEKQGQRVGRLLMRHTFEQADRAGLPCYLETATERNVAMHGSQGYELRGTLEVPDSDLKLYLMVRPPKPPAQ